jgi:hypothetical protein
MCTEKTRQQSEQSKPIKSLAVVKCKYDLLAEINLSIDVDSYVNLPCKNDKKYMYTCGTYSKLLLVAFFTVA